MVSVYFFFRTASAEAQVSSSESLWLLISSRSLKYLILMGMSSFRAATTNFWWSFLLVSAHFIGRSGLTPPLTPLGFFIAELIICWTSVSLRNFTKRVRFSNWLGVGFPTLKHHRISMTATTSANMFSVFLKKCLTDSSADPFVPISWNLGLDWSIFASISNILSCCSVTWAVKCAIVGKCNHILLSLDFQVLQYAPLDLFV